MKHRVRCQLAVFPLIGHVPGFAPRTYHREEASHRFRYLLQWSRALAADRSLGLVFLHLPVPHPPAIYSRAEGKFATRGSNNYLDSVALADRTLGELRQSIEEAGLRDNTVLIVSADHGWRMDWRGGPDWTAEEEAASRGIDTSGVPFLVNFPREESGVAYGRRFDTVVTNRLVLDILRRQVTGSTQLPEWLEAR